MTAELEQLKASKIMMNPRKRTRVEVVIRLYLTPCYPIHWNIFSKRKLKSNVYFYEQVSDVIELDDSIYRIDDSFDDDHEMDPDWQKTPLFKAKRKTTVCMLNIYKYT